MMVSNAILGGIGVSLLVSLIVTLVTLFSPVKRVIHERIHVHPITIQSTTAGPSYGWNLKFPQPVILDFQNTVNYQLNGSVADKQWEALIPSNGGLVYLGPTKQPFMLSTFHQLRCLDEVRRSYVKDADLGHANPTPLTRHCMNYLRQMVLCRGDSRLERVVDPFGSHAVQIRDPQTCRDWRSLYSKVDENSEMKGAKADR